MTSHEIRNKSPDRQLIPAVITNPIAARDHTQREENTMKTTRCFSTFSRIGFSSLLMLTILAVTPHYAAATTASNTAIINTVTVNYKDAGGTSQAPVTSSATVTISLVPASPTLSAPADQNTSLNVAATYTYTITSNANGPDNYVMTIPSKVNTANITASTAVPSLTPIPLGATTIFTPVTIAAGGTTAIIVPSDSVSNGSVNGISAAVGNNSVVINGQVYTVASIVDNAAGTSTITVTGNGTATALLPYGTIIGEQKTFTLAVTPTAMNATVANETITTTLSARDSGSIAVAATDVTVTTVPAANLTVTKEVSLTGTAGTFAATANAAPGALLYYRITVHNGGAANATLIVITDPISSYTTYTAGSGRRVTGAAAAYGGTVLTDLSAVDDGYDYAVTTAGTVTYSVASIAPGVANDVQLFFTATVK
jgi:uncharacterized repeat protein (TIGR01451 family)